MSKTEREPSKPKMNHAKSGKRKALPLWLAIPTAVYIAFLVGLTGINSAGPDQWSLGSFNLYVPQWLYLLPALGLLPLFLWRSRRMAWIPLLCALWVLGPIMGFCWRWVTPTADETKGTRLRVMTYNVKNGRYGMDAIAADIQKFHPDILLCQESNGTFRAAAQNLLIGWNIQVSVQFLIASKRFPLSVGEARYVNFPGYGTQVLRCTTTAGGRAVTLYTAHLKSPRGGLIAELKHLRHPNQTSDAPVVWNTDLRPGQAHILAGFLREETNPTILTGDLNAPVQSLACREFFNEGFRDAFSEAGRGYGYSYGQKVRRMPFAYVRIDHVMLSKEWQALDCKIGNNEGSEHRPVIADLYLPNAK